MTDEELREKIAEILFKSYYSTMNVDIYTDQILALIRESGYKSPEEIEEITSKLWGDGFKAGQDSKG